MSKINKEQLGDELPEFQNPFRNPKWWENDLPPEEVAEDGINMVRNDIGEIKLSLIDNW